MRKAHSASADAHSRSRPAAPPGRTAAPRPIRTKSRRAPAAPSWRTAAGWRTAERRRGRSSPRTAPAHRHRPAISARRRAAARLYPPRRFPATSFPARTLPLLSPPASPPPPILPPRATDWKSAAGAEYKDARSGNNGQAVLMANSTGEPASGTTSEDIEAFAAGLPARTALIGIDAGTKTLGLALSDITRTIASPLKVIRRTKFKEDAADLLHLPQSIGSAASYLDCRSISTAGRPAGARDAGAGPQPQRAERVADPLVGRAPFDGRGRAYCWRPTRAGGGGRKSSTSWRRR